MHTTSTDCRSLDRLLDGGLESDAITLVFGEGGSGKTNLALQCARVVAAAGKRVAYVDTEGVSQKRLQQVFDALPDEERAPAEERLLFFTPYTIDEQEKMVKRTSLLRDVGLIVVDSINMHYRLHIDAPGGEKEARQSLLQQLHHLTMHARQHHIPVLVTGQVYGGEDETQPFARRVMEHLVKALVRFEKRPDGSRRATVLKHRSIEEGRQTRFRIGGHGLEDLDETRRATDAGGTAPPRRPDASGAVEPSPAPGGDGSSPGPTPEPDPRRTPPPDRDEARREADAWGVDADDREPGAEDDAGDAGPRAVDAGRGTPPRDPTGTDDADGADEPADAAGTGAAPEADDDAPATSLLTEKERRDAEALPGFSPASKLPPPQRAEEDADGR